MPQTHAKPADERPPAAPRWVKVSCATFLVLALLFGVLHLTGHGPGGPGSHAAHGARRP